MKAIVLHQRKFEFEFWPIRKFHFIQLGPVLSAILNFCPITGPSTILNYCPIRWLLFPLPSWLLVQSQAHLPFWIIVQSDDCFPFAILNFCPIRGDKKFFVSPCVLTGQKWCQTAHAQVPPHPPWHRTLTFTLLKILEKWSKLILFILNLLL